MYPITERILFGLGEAIAIVIFSMYLFDVTDLMKYELDFIGLAVILFLDLMIFIIRFIGWMCYGKRLGVVTNNIV